MAHRNWSLTVLPGSTVGKSPWVEMESCCSDLHEYWRCLIYIQIFQNGILQQKPLGFFTPCSEMRYIWSCHLWVPSIAPLEHSEKSLNGFQSSRIPCFFLKEALHLTRFAASYVILLDGDVFYFPLKVFFLFLFANSPFEQCSKLKTLVGCLIEGIMLLLNVLYGAVIGRIPAPPGMQKSCK